MVLEKTMFDISLIREIPDLYSLTAEVLEQTPWETGRLAGMSEGESADNPFDPDSVTHAEWAKGFFQGRSDNDKRVPAVPERSFWATVYDIQIKGSMSVQETALAFDYSEQELVERMKFYRFYDDDGIPLDKLEVA